VQQLPIPAKTSSIHSCRSERRLTPRALGVSGAVPFPAFLMAYKTVVGDPGITFLSSRVVCREQQHTNDQRRELAFFWSTWFATWREMSLVRREKREVYFTFPLHRVLHHSLKLDAAAIHPRNQCIDGAEKTEKNAAKTSDEAGATPLFDARCVTSFRGVAPASSRRKRGPFWPRAGEEKGSEKDLYQEITRRTSFDHVFDVTKIAKRESNRGRTTTVRKRSDGTEAVSSKVHMHTLITRACRKGRSHGNSQSSTQTTEE